MTRALILGLALFCGQLMADPCDAFLIKTAGDFAQQHAAYDLTTDAHNLNGWTPVVTGAKVLAEYEAGAFNVLHIQVLVDLTYPGQPNSPYPLEYWITANLLNRQISQSTQAEIDIATAAPPAPPPPVPPVVVNPVVINPDNQAYAFAQYWLNHDYPGLFTPSISNYGVNVPVYWNGTGDQYSYLFDLSNGDQLQVVFAIGQTGDVSAASYTYFDH